MVGAGQRWRSEAVAVFGDLGVQVVTGHRFLGGFIESRSEKDEYVMSKVRRWVGHLDVLAEAALTQPQLAYAALSRSLQHEWTFLLRIVPRCGQLFQEIELSLFSRFLPAMFGVEVSAVERRLFALPLRLGSLGICKPVSWLLICLILQFVVLYIWLDLLLGLRFLNWIRILIVFLLISYIIVTN